MWLLSLLCSLLRPLTEACRGAAADSRGVRVFSGDLWGSKLRLKTKVLYYMLLKLYELKKGAANLIVCAQAQNILCTPMAACLILSNR